MYILNYLYIYKLSILYLFMKAYRTFTIDYEIAELLSKEENQSKIINDLLKSYFNAKTPKTLEEMEKELKRLDAKKAYAMALEAIGR